MTGQNVARQVLADEAASSFDTGGCLGMCASPAFGKCRQHPRAGFGGIRHQNARPSAKQTNPRTILNLPTFCAPMATHIERAGKDP